MLTLGVMIRRLATVHGGGRCSAWPHTVMAGEVRRGQEASSGTLGRPIPYSLYLPDGYADSHRAIPYCFCCTATAAPRTTGPTAAVSPPLWTG